MPFPLSRLLIIACLSISSSAGFDSLDPSAASALFDSSPHPSAPLFVPGRLCLFGEHSDWAADYRSVDSAIPQGRAIVACTQQGIYANVKLIPTPEIIFISTLNDGSRCSSRCPLTYSSLLSSARSPSFFSYGFGVAHQMLTTFDFQSSEPPFQYGLIIDNYRTTLPLSKGLSSSAAFCVLVVRAFNLLYSLHLATEGIMEFAYRGERVTGSKCGRLDQCCAFPSNSLVNMNFLGDSIHCQTVNKPQKNNNRESIYLLLVDLKRCKDTKRILSALNTAYPVAKSEIDHGVQWLFGASNIEITEQAIQILEQKTSEENQPSVAQRLGELMTLAQQRFDQFAIPACPDELTAPALHAVLQCQQAKQFTWGGKGVGSQGDGTAQFVCKSRDARTRFAAHLVEHFGVETIQLDLGGDTK